MTNLFHKSAAGKPTLVGCVLSVAMLSACSQTPGNRPARPVTIQPIANDQQRDDAVALLEAGDLAGARKLLGIMVKRDKADLKTAALLASIDADPVAALGTKSFIYKVQPGDRMTLLAPRFLGNRLSFYTLSRYNGIAVPASLRPGQSIRIPGTAPVPAPVIHSPRIVPKAAEAAKTPPAALQRPAVNPQRALQLRGGGLAALSQGKVDRAAMLLRQAAALDPGNANIKRDLQRAERLRATVGSRR